MNKIKVRDLTKLKINNIGFIESLKSYPNIDKILFNDVDNYPLKKDIIDYTFIPKGVHHLFGRPKVLGGFFIISKKRIL